MIQNNTPCISCACFFLVLQIFGSRSMKNTVKSCSRFSRSSWCCTNSFAPGKKLVQCEPYTQNISHACSLGAMSYSIHLKLLIKQYIFITEIIPKLVYGMWLCCSKYFLQPTITQLILECRIINFILGSLHRWQIKSQFIMCQCISHKNSIHQIQNSLMNYKSTKSSAFAMWTAW